MIELLKKRKKNLIIYLIAATFPAIRDFLRTFLYSYIFKTIQKQDLESLKIAIFLGIGFIILSFILYVTSRFMRITFMRDTLLDVRINTFEKIINTDYATFSKKSKDTYVSNLVNDINEFENNFFINFLNFIYRILIYSIAVIILLIIDYKVGIILVTSSILIYLIIRIFQKTTIKYQKEISLTNEDLTLNLSNTFNGLEILKLNNIEKKFTKKIDEKITDLENKKSKFRFLIDSQLSITQNIGLILCIFLIFYLVSKNNFDYSHLILIIQLSSMILYSLPDIFPRLNVIKASSEIYNKITKLETSINSKPKPNKFKFTNEIKVTNLSFAYDNKEIFKDASFTIKKGKKYLIKGPSGIGKSTLIKLLSQTFENYTGSITIDGVDIKTIDSKSLNENIAFVYQDVFLFQDTIKNNITLYKDIPNEKIFKAISLSGLNNFLENKSLDFVIDENGKNLSGGERQRISIARGIAKEAQILFIDEGTSALNQELGSEIEEKITNLDTTVIAISHRYYPNVSEKYDYVLEINEGKVTQYLSKDYFQAEAKYV